MAARMSSIRSDRIDYSLRLIFDERGGVRMTRSGGNLARDERELSLTVKLPRAIFATPALAATITIADPGTDAPAIDIAGIERQLRAAIGTDCVIEIAPRSEAPA